MDWVPVTCPHLGCGPGPTTQVCALIGNRTNDLLVCKLAPSPLSHTNHGFLETFSSTLLLLSILLSSALSGILIDLSFISHFYIPGTMVSFEDSKSLPLRNS